MAPQGLPLRLSRNTIRPSMVATMTEPTPPSPPHEAQPIRLPLTQLKRGDRAVVAEAALSHEDRAILQAMGLDESCTFTVCRAGSGGPCIIQVDATRLGLSPDLARRIMTRPCDCPDAGHCAADGAAESKTATSATSPGSPPSPPSPA